MVEFVHVPSIPVLTDGINLVLQQLPESIRGICCRWYAASHPDNGKRLMLGLLQGNKSTAHFLHRQDSLF